VAVQNLYDHDAKFCNLGKIDSVLFVAVQ